MLGLIWAQAHNRALGKQGQLPWHVPEDLAMFKKITAQNPVIMGRKTWESLNPKYRPLPKRDNYVITRNLTYTATGATVCANLEHALELCQATQTDTMVWVIGGAQIYESALPKADVLVVTDLNIEVTDADTFAPRISFDWDILSAYPERGWLHSRSGIDYRFSIYKKPKLQLPNAELLFSLPDKNHCE